MNDLLELKDYMVDLVYEYVPGVKRVGSNKLNFRCPICGDGKKSTSHRGWFYIDTGSYYCWNSGCPANESGMSGIKFLAAVSGKPIVEIKQELIKRAGTFKKGFSYNVKSISNIFNDEDKKEEKTYITEKVKDGEWTDQLPLFVKEYIEKRHLQDATFLPSWFKFYYDKKFKRLVIPWSDEYYQERTVMKSQWQEDKYKFPPGIEKPIFGLDTIDPNFKYIFILEGVFDSVWCKNGIAAGSLRLSNHQRDILKTYENDFKLVWMPDNQLADHSSYEKTMKIIQEHPYENVFIWPKELKKFKDVNDTIIFSEKFIEIWKSEKFLTKNIASGLMAQLRLKDF